MVERHRSKLRRRIYELETRVEELEGALLEALDMVEDAGKAYVNYDLNRVLELRSLAKKGGSE